MAMKFTNKDPKARALVYSAALSRCGITEEAFRENSLLFET
jgi:hypothetical protein